MKSKLRTAILDFKGKKVTIEIPEYIYLMYRTSNETTFPDEMEVEGLFDQVFNYISEYLGNIAKVEFNNKYLEVDVFLVSDVADIHCELMIDTEQQDEDAHEHDIEKENNDDFNRTIAKYIGYFQPECLEDKICSFEVYSSYQVAKKIHPNQRILTFTGNEIENFEFADVPYYDQSWEDLLNIYNSLIASRNIDIRFADIDDVHETIPSKDVSKLKEIIVRILNYNNIS